MIKLIVVDLDFTLLNSQSQLSERNATALRKALDEGVQVVLATGKTRPAAAPIFERLGVVTPGIFIQGLAIYYPDGSIRHQQTLDIDLARRVITFAEDRGFDVIAYSGERLLVRRMTPGAEELATHYHEPMPEAVGALQNILNEVRVNKLIITRKDDQRRIAAVRWQLTMQLNSAARLVQGHPYMLEVLPPGASKGKALKTLIKELGIHPEHMLAIGDGENDIEMLELAGIGVAVGNAVEKLKAVADYVVGTNDEDGVAEAVERFVLKKDEPTSAPAAEAAAAEPALPVAGEAPAPAAATVEAETPVETNEVTSTPGEEK